MVTTENIKVKEIKTEKLSPEEYFYIVIPYLSHIVNNHKTLRNLRVHSSNETQFGEWKIQLTISIKHISFKNFNETRKVYTKSDNEEIIIGSETNNIIEERRKSLLQNYHNNLKESMRGSEFVHSGIDLLYFHLQRIGLNKKANGRKIKRQQ